MEKIEKDVKNIADRIIQSRNIPYFSGLLHGKLGIAVFLCHYSSYNQNDLYSEFAYKLIMEAHWKDPVNYAYGLSGIGTGIEYLVQNNYMEADTDEILEDFDVVLSRALIDYSSLSSLNQILDIGKYFSFRINNTKRNTDIKENIERVVRLIEMQFLREPLCSHRVIDLLYSFRNISLKASHLLDDYCNLFGNQYFVEKSFGWYCFFYKASSIFPEMIYYYTEINKWMLDRYHLLNSANNSFIQKNIEYFMWSLISENKILPEQLNLFLNQSESDNFSLLNGLSGIGLSLLSFMDKKHSSWIDLL
jgi:hypothetical protein